MLLELTIKNVAVIDRLNVEFRKGLSVLTGETGAGKSIIIDSINMILGERANKEFVRHGCDRAEVEAVFESDPRIDEILEKNDIDRDDNIIISRKLSEDGKSQARINGTAVTLNTLREVTEELVNIHGQHDNQALLTPARHIQFLDGYARCGDELTVYRMHYQKRQNIIRELDELMSDKGDKLQRIDLLTYQVEEIETADLSIGEEEELKKIRDTLERCEEIREATEIAYGALYENDEVSAYDMISTALKSLEKVSDANECLQRVYDAITEAMYTIGDSAREVREFAREIDSNPETLNEIEERLDLINRLKRKYGGTVESVLEFGKNARAELTLIETSDERINELKEDLDKCESELELSAERLSDKRRSAAQLLSAGIEKALHELNMEKARFSVQVDSKDYSPNGCDRVEFMISTNPGEALKPLSRIASGGELSRVMLAIKSILVTTDGVGTVIFDEIDTGVSGLAAEKIADKLKIIAGSAQVICITHLPQLAVAADNHLLIEKDVAGDMAKTTLTELDYEGRVHEVARIVGGGKVGEEYARRMLK